MITQAYVGSELELFSRATCWKSYVSRSVAPYLGARVLEVGAGIGTTTAALCRQPHEAWICLEPDATQAGEIRQRKEAGELPACCEVRVGTLEGMDTQEWFDSILYMDVLEHIADDQAECRRAAAHLRPGGHLVILSPAHQSLFTPFDAAIGHYRRYSKQSLACAVPTELQRVSLRYLDSVGLLASLSNRLFLRQSMPTARQIAVWDKCLVRASRLMDPLLMYCLGKSVLGIWRKADTRVDNC